MIQSKQKLKEFWTMGGLSKKIQPENNKSFGKRLAKIRKAKGLTQAELGARIGATQRAMHHYENKAEYPPAQKIIELAQALDMSVDELLGISENENDDYQNINPKLAKRLRLASIFVTESYRIGVGVAVIFRFFRDYLFFLPGTDILGGFAFSHKNMAVVFIVERQ